MPLDAHLDHLAIAVPDADEADRRWRDELGGRHVAWGDDGSFFSRQLRYRGGAKLELLTPPQRGGSPDGFVERFLTRFGARTHHVTLKVPDLGAALDVVAAEGFEPVGVRTDLDFWHEAFLHPRQVGGLVVQIAWSGQSDEQWAAAIGHTPQPPTPDAARFVAGVVRHDDLGRAARMWELLGARVERSGEALTCRWPESPLTLVVEAAEAPDTGPLRFAGTSPLPAHPRVGPAVEVVADI